MIEASHADPAQDAALAACLLVVDPAGLGGVALCAASGPAVADFLKLLRGLMPAGSPFRRVPSQIADSRLLGGLDLAATLQAGRPVFERGLLADADGGLLVLPMAERLPLPMAAKLCAVLDSGEVAVERDGFACRNASSLAVVALDEGVSGDERPPAALMDRLALHIDLAGVRHDGIRCAPFDAARIEAARTALHRVEASEAICRALCHAAAAIGIASVRAPMLAIKVACVHAALSGRVRIEDQDAIVASRLVLAPRATVLPAPAPGERSEDDNVEPDRQQSPGDRSLQPNSPDNDANDVESGEFEDIVLDAVRAAIPANLLAQLQTAGVTRKSPSAAGRAGAQRQPALRGRPAGTRRGELKAGARLNVVETLRAAAPWQKLRRLQTGTDGVQVRRDDFRLQRFKHRSESATIFVVDASGSSALHRLAEAKGAVELLLADCYVRRDQVALIAFRGKCADVILPPTRSLPRAKRSLAAMPGGGGTPVAAALDAAGALADGLRRKNLAPTIVLLTDGRANVALDGTGGRERAEADAHGAARRCKALRLTALLVDTSPVPGPAAERLALEMGARYLPLPRGDAAAISALVRSSGAPETARAG